ncbi:patched domain-containing protein 3 isoform X2 [Hyalella azteca]|uniref:Patched domain-containing protein 3 isoform X2 n=1 Tax=Hyalella azteca TaxID=294128 RepID=A0A8B7NKG5_HYAAZ|nr:patched domain-containing protein 3 isoform X2 [Hyalella azteca]
MEAQQINEKPRWEETGAAFGRSSSETTQPVKRKMGWWLEKFDSFLNRSFYKLGANIATNTGYYIIIPILLTAICATGFQRIQYEDDPEYLFAPTNGRAKQERAVVEEFFKVNFTWDFHPARVTRNGRFARFIMVAKDNGSLLREEVWNDISTVDQMVHNVTIAEEGRKFQYKDLCAIWGEECFENQVLDIGELIPEINNNTFNLTYPFMLNPRTFESYVFPFHFGGIETSNSSTIVSVKAITLYYWIRTQDSRQDRMGSLWEKQLLADFKDLDMDNVIVTFFTSRTLETELENNTHSVIPYFGLTVAIILVFCLLTVMMGDCVRSKTLLGLAGILCAGLSCAAAFGLLIYIGVPFIGINMAAPFLMLGIGIDDTFVMLASWRRSRIQDPVPERLAHTFADAAVSITITSITDMISFFIGAITPFPSVQIFCIYTGTAVLMTYLWHITLFGALLALSGYAEQKQLHNLACIPVKPVSESKDEDCCYRACCSGGISKTDPYNPEDNKRHAIMVLFRDYVAVFLNIPAVKALVVLIFLGYLSVAIWGCTMVTEGLERRKLSRYDSYSVQYYDLEDTYFRAFPYRIQIIFAGDYEYHDNATADAILGFLEKVEALPNIGDPLYTVSWLRSWRSFMERNGEYLGINNTDEVSLIQNLKEYYLSGSANMYALDVALNEDETRIIASRFVVQAFEVTDALKDRQLMEDLRKLADESSLNVTVFHPFFIFFDQFTLVRSTSIQTISLAAAIMMVVSLIFIPNPLCSLWVAFSIISIEIGVVGYMTLWGVNLDSISMIQLIMCIGFSVDFSAHISYAYLAAKVDTPDERVKECLYSLGLPIVQGGLSTILGIMALVLAPSYIFITFFKTVFLVIFFGAIHGLFLLPVLLSLLGPGSFSKNKKKDAVVSHPMYYENGGFIMHNGIGSMPVHPALPISPNHLPPHLQLSTDKQLQIPRPKSFGNHPSQKIVTSPPVSCYKNNAYLGPAASGGLVKEESGSLERDLGLGTSGEESSESSLRQGVGRKTSALPTIADSRKIRDPGHEAYQNNGYISDSFEAERRRAFERRGDYFDEWDNHQPERNPRWQSARYNPSEARGYRLNRNEQYRGEPYRPHRHSADNPRKSAIERHRSSADNYRSSNTAATSDLRNSSEYKRTNSDNYRSSVEVPRNSKSRSRERH